MHRSLLLVSTLFAISGPLPADAQGGAGADEADFLDRKPEDCIRVSRIRRTKVVDDETILFYMRGRRVYRNELDFACSGLARTGQFIMESRTGNLCSVDTVTSFRRFGGSIFPGMTCMLGEFHPITEEEAELMELELDEAAERQGSVIMTPVDPDAVDETEAADETRDETGGETGDE